MRNLYWYFLVFFICLAELSFSAPNTQFAEQELVFSGRMRSAKLTLVNRGDVTSTVALNFLQPIYSEQKNPEDITIFKMFDVNEIDLDQFPYNFKLKDAIRITPKRVTLKPGEKQAVRLILKKPIDLQDGVYRANVAVEYLDVRHEELESLKPETEENIAVGMGFVTSIHIPLIIIHGEVNTILEEFKILDIKQKPLEKVSRSANSDIKLSFKTSGNSIGQYVVKIYTDLDPDDPIFNRTEEISNFVNYHVKSYSVFINEGATNIRVVIQQLGTLETLEDVTKDIRTLY